MATINLPTNIAVPLEKDELYKDELSEKYKALKEAKLATNAIESQIRELRRLNAISKGLEPAYINTSDLIIIIEDLLLTKDVISKIFERYELNENQCAKWADRTIIYRPDKYELTQAVNYLLDNRNKNNATLNLMKNYDILDINSLIKSNTYREALNKLKKQLNIAMRLKGKDDQLADKDKIISDKDIEIKKLNEELVRDKSKDWKLRAIELKKQGTSVSKIAKRLGKGRTNISTYLNKPEIKAELEESKAS